MYKSYVLVVYIARELKPEYQFKENPTMANAPTQGSRKALTWGDESYLNPLACLPDSANARALGNETSLVKLYQNEYNHNASKETTKDKDGKSQDVLCVLSNGISLPTDHNMRALNHNVTKGPTKLGTITLQQHSQLQGTPKVFKTMVKNHLIVGNYGRSYETKENHKSYNSSELESRVGNQGLKLLDIPFREREKEDNTINNIDRAINPGAVSDMFQKYGINGLAGLATRFVTFL